MTKPGIGNLSVDVGERKLHDIDKVMQARLVEQLDDIVGFYGSQGLGDTAQWQIVLW